MDSDWTVSFTGLGRAIPMKKLHSWSEDEETKFYSGEAIYERDLSVSDIFVKAPNRIYLDFGSGSVVEQNASDRTIRAWLEGPVREAAQVFVNGRAAGAIWKPPYRLEISGLLQTGKNHLKVVVGNTAINSLASQSLPDYRLLNSRYGERFVPQGMDNLQPLASGLLGPVRLIAEEEP